MKYFTKEVKIALVAIVGVVLLYIGMNFLKGLAMYSDDNNYKIAFSNIQGLANSCPIYADGYRVGTVVGINYDYEKSGNIIVEADIDKNLRIPLGSTAEIASDLLGNTQVNILLANNPRERINPGDVISGIVSEGAMGELKAMVPAVQQMLPKLDSIMASLNALLADPAIAATLHNAQTISSNLTTSTQELNKLMATLNKQVPGLMHKADGVMTNTETLTANLAALDVEGTMAQVNTTLANVKNLTDALNSKEGTIGLLLHDPGLYNNMTATMSSADSLLIDLKSHPKRYVHFSIFGKKDK